METAVYDPVDTARGAPAVPDGDEQQTGAVAERMQHIVHAGEGVRRAYEAWLAATDGMTPEQRARCVATLFMVNATGKQIQRSVHEYCGDKTQHRQL